MAITLNATTLTLGQAKTRVARVGSSQDDTDALAVAGECIEDVLSDLNNGRDWTWMQRTASVTVTVAGEVDTPTLFKKVYSITDGNQTYLPAYQRDLDRQLGGQTLGGNYLYKTFDIASSSKVKFVDSIPVGTVATVNYIAMITLPGADGTAFDLPSNVMPYVLARAKAQFLADKGGNDTRLTYYMTAADKRYARLVIEDEKNGDTSPGFVPASDTVITPSWRYELTTEA